MLFDIALVVLMPVGPFYLLIGVNAVALACWVFFYFPPDFETKHPSGRILDYVKNFDCCKCYDIMQENLCLLMLRRVLRVSRSWRLRKLGPELMRAQM